MKAGDLYGAAPGSVFLVFAHEKDQAGMVEDVIAGANAGMKTSGLCAANIVTMDMIGGKGVNEFSDLSALCRKLITAAGYRHHFDGLLLLNISALMDKRNEARLRALGELLAMEKGLASGCRTLLFGPTNEIEMLFCAQLLDTAGRLQADVYEREAERESFPGCIRQAGVACQSRQIEGRVRRMMKEASGCPGYDAVKYLRAAAGEDGVICDKSLDKMETMPYSYHNRLFRELCTREFGERRIGFGA